MSNKKVALLVIPFAITEGLLRYLAQVVPGKSTLWHVLEFVVLAILIVVTPMLIFKTPNDRANYPTVSYWKYFVVLFLYFFCADKLRAAQIDRPSLGIVWLIIDIAATGFFMYAIISPTFLAKRKK